MKKMLLITLCIGSLLANSPEETIIIPAECDIQRKKETESERSAAVDTLRVIGGLGCLVAAWTCYREARREWVGISDNSLMERVITRLKELPAIKQIRDQMSIGGKEEPAIEEELTAYLKQRAATMSKFDITENVVLAIAFGYFGFNLLAKGLRIKK